MTNIIDIQTKEVVLVEEQSISTLDILDSGTVSVIDEVLTLISEATQGPPGVAAMDDARAVPILESLVAEALGTTGIDFVTAYQMNT